MNILIIDDHMVILDGLKSIIPRKDFTIIAEAHNASTALHYFRHLEVDIVITDIQLPDKSGIELIREFRKIKPGTRFIVLSMFDERAMVNEALEAGADSYIVKSAEPAELIRALERVAIGKKYLSQELAQSFWFNEGLPETQKSLLSEREKEVLKLILHERSNKDIAEELFISERTVESHRKNLYRKTNTETLVGLVKYAIDHKLVG
jgi:DNA-binding NarL/FixJ family response regulator